MLTAIFSRASILLVLFLLLTKSVLAREIVYPVSSNGYYNAKLLAHVLSYSKKDYRLKRYKEFLPKKRAYHMMKQGRGIDIVFGSANIERETDFQAIYFPIMKGLYGWRIPLVHKDNVDLFKAVYDLSDFKKLTPGLSETWSDTQIMEKNGIRVQKSNSAKVLYQMLGKQRFDYFPRSALKIAQDFQRNKHYKIAIEPHIFIHYPTAFYFYVSREDKELAKDLKDGFEQAFLDGSFDNIFNEYFGEQVAHLKKQNRRVFHLDNPFLSKKAPLDHKDLWLEMSKTEDNHH